MPRGFKPNSAGYAQMLNMQGVQNACLGIAKTISAGAAGIAAESGFTLETDVQTGKRRCHARASAAVPSNPKPEAYYRNRWYGNTVALALQAGVLGFPSGTLGELSATHLKTRKDKKTGGRKYVNSSKEKFQGKRHIGTKKKRRRRKKK